MFISKERMIPPLKGVGVQYIPWHEEKFIDYVIERYLPAKGNILDLAGGGFRFAIPAALKKRYVTVVDIDKGSLDLPTIIKRINENGKLSVDLKKIRNFIKVENIDVFSFLTLERRRFNFISAFRFIHFLHPQQIELLFSLVSKRLTKNGFFAVSAMTMSDSKNNKTNEFFLNTLPVMQNNIFYREFRNSPIARKIRREQNLPQNVHIVDSQFIHCLAQKYGFEVIEDGLESTRVVRGYVLKRIQTDITNKSIPTIQHTQQLYGIRPQAKEFPAMCVIGLVYVCNAFCENCPYTNSKIRSNYKNRPFMNEDTFKIIADQCGEYGAWIRISGGGEPMLHPKAVELMEYAKKVGARVGLITNGSKFTEESSIRLLKAQIDMIEFSVDAADPVTYAKVRKALDWDTLLKNLRRMIDLRDSLKSPTKIIASAINQVDVNIEEVAKFWESIVDNFQKRKYLTWGINDPSKSADPTPYLLPEEMIPCPFIFERLNIDSRGKVMVCGYDIAAVTDMGNIHEKSIKEIWHGKDFEYYRQMHLSQRGIEIELCKNCSDWKYRSWRHNYWKIMKHAEEKRLQRYEKLDI